MQRQQIKITNERESYDKKVKCVKLKEYRWRKEARRKDFDKRGRNFGLWMLSPNIPKLSISNQIIKSLSCKGGSLIALY